MWDNEGQVNIIAVYGFVVKDNKYKEVRLEEAIYGGG